MAYTSWSVVFGEQPSAAKWNILGTNDSSFNDGTGIAGQYKNLLTVDSNPYKFQVTATSGASYGTAETQVAFNSEIFDTNNNFATNQYTAPVAGFYIFYFHCHTAPNTSDTSCFAKLYKNGAAYTQIAYSANGTNVNRGLSGMAMMSLATSDTVRIYIGTTGASITTVASGTDVPLFGGWLDSRT